MYYLISALRTHKRDLFDYRVKLETKDQYVDYFFSSNGNSGFTYINNANKYSSENDAINDYIRNKSRIDFSDHDENSVSVLEVNFKVVKILN